MKKRLFIFQTKVVNLKSGKLKPMEVATRTGYKNSKVLINSILPLPTENILPMQIKTSS
jgi:hypothetical protein